MKGFCQIEIKSACTDFLQNVLKSRMNVVFCQELLLHLLRWSCDLCPCFILCNALYFWFPYTEASLLPWGETYLVMMYRFFIIYFILLLILCCGFLCLCSIKRLLLSPSWSFYGIGIRVMLVSKNEFGNTPLQFH